MCFWNIGTSLKLQRKNNLNSFQSENKCLDLDKSKLFSQTGQISIWLAQNSWTAKKCKDASVRLKKVNKVCKINFFPILWEALSNLPLGMAVVLASLEVLAPLVFDFVPLIHLSEPISTVNF